MPIIGIGICFRLVTPARGLPTPGGTRARGGRPARAASAKQRVGEVAGVTSKHLDHAGIHVLMRGSSRPVGG